MSKEKTQPSTGGEPSGEAGKSGAGPDARGPGARHRPPPRRPRKPARLSRAGIHWRALTWHDYAGFVLVGAMLCLWAYLQFWFPNIGSPSTTEIVASALSCTRPFKPEETLDALQQGRFIGPEPVRVIDGAPVFAVLRPFSAYGLVVRFVEGWDREGRLFSRAPGAAPQRHLTVTVNGDKDYVERAIRQRFPAQPQDSKLARYLDERPTVDANAEREGPLTGIVCVLPEG